MKKSLKRLLCVVCAVMSLIGITMTASADTVEFTITANTDTLSKKVKKGDTYYENRAYVTATYFNRAGTFQCMAACYSKPNIVSEDMYVSGTGGYTGEVASAKDSGEYYSSAPGGIYYYMSASANSNGLNMLGRFTP